MLLARDRVSAYERRSCGTGSWPAHGPWSASATGPRSVWRRSSRSRRPRLPNWPRRARRCCASWRRTPARSPSSSERMTRIGQGAGPSASFRLWLLLSGVCAGQPWIWAGGVYYPGVGLGWSAGWGVAVEREQVVERLLGGGAVGEDAPGAGAALAAVVVEQDGLLDARQLSQQLTNRQVQPRLVGMAAQQVRDR